MIQLILVIDDSLQPLNSLKTEVHERRLEEVLERLKTEVRTRRLMLYPYFRDYDRVRAVDKCRHTLVRYHMNN